MTISEFSDQFDLLYNNITSNQAPGLSEYEKSVFLTKGEKEVVKNYFTANSRGNTIGQGFDDSAKRQADFSVLMKTARCAPISVSGRDEVVVRSYDCTSGTRTAKVNLEDLVIVDSITRQRVYPGLGLYTVDSTFNVYSTDSQPQLVGSITSGWPFAGAGQFNCVDTTYVYLSGLIDDRSSTYQFPSDTYIIINETLKTRDGKRLQVVPLRFDEYTRLMSKPFKYPLKNQAWRLINSGSVVNNAGLKVAEIITNAGDQDKIDQYNVRYVRVPKPIILTDLPDDLTIDGESRASVECEIDPILHEDVLQRAVELAKIAWTATGQDNAQLEITAGQRSE